MTDIASHGSTRPRGIKLRSRLTLFAAIVTLPVCLSIFTPIADAAILSGTFTGIAEDSRVNATSPHPGNFDGTIVTGSFSLDPSGNSLLYGGSGGATYTPGSSTGVSLEFVSAGGTFDFPSLIGDPGGVFSLYNAGQTQQLTMNPGFFDPYYNAALTLTGAAGSFFTGVDPATLHDGAVTAASAYFFGGRDTGASVVITALTLDGVTTNFTPPSAVPLPAAWLMLGSGLIGLAGIGLLRRFVVKGTGIA